MQALKTIHIIFSFLFIYGCLGDEPEKPRFQVDHKSGKLDITATKESAEINSMEDFVDVVMKPGEQKPMEDSSADQRHSTPDKKGPSSEVAQGDDKKNSSVDANKKANSTSDDRMNNKTVEYPKVYNSTKQLVENKTNDDFKSMQGDSETKSILELEKEAADIANTILNSSRDENGLSFIKDNAEKLEEKVAQLNQTLIESQGMSFEQEKNLTRSALNLTSEIKSERDQKDTSGSETAKDKESKDKDKVKSTEAEKESTKISEMSDRKNETDVNLSKTDNSTQRNGDSNTLKFDESFDLDDAEPTPEELKIIGKFSKKNVTYALDVSSNGDQMSKTTGDDLNSTASSEPGNVDAGSKDYNRIEPNLTLNESMVKPSLDDTYNRSLTTGDGMKTLQDFEKVVESFLKKSDLKEREELLKLTWHDLRKKHSGRNVTSLGALRGTAEGKTVINGSNSAVNISKNNSINDTKENELKIKLREAIATESGNNTVVATPGSVDWMKTFVGRLKNKISLLRDVVESTAQNKLRKGTLRKKNPYEGFKREKISDKMDWLNARVGKLGLQKKLLGL